MTQKNKESMQRAIGILEGVSWMIENNNLQDAICTACEILDAVFNSEENDDGDL